MSKKTTQKVVAIIPAYNEEERITTVLEAIEKSGCIDEIVVVNDGSSDKTADVVGKFPNVILINMEQNKGKGSALMNGIENTDGDIFVFIDADLIGFTPEHVESLVQPLLSDNDLVMTVGKFAGGRLLTDLSQSLVPFISGQRALRRSFLDGIDFSDTGFGVEIALTRHAKEQKAKVKEVIMNDVTHIMKEEKLGLAKGAWARFGMYSDMVKHLISDYFNRP